MIINHSGRKYAPLCIVFNKLYLIIELILNPQMDTKFKRILFKIYSFIFMINTVYVKI